MKRFGGKKSRRKHLTAGTHGRGGGRSWQAPVKMAPAPRAYTTAVTYCQALSCKAQGSFTKIVCYHIPC